MKKLRRIFVGGIIALLVLAGSLTLLVKIYEEELKAAVIAQLNEQLLSPVRVGGDIYVSLWENFPSVSLSFRQLEVEAVENERGAGYTLATADRLSLSFSLLSVLRQRYELEELGLYRAKIDLRFDKEGNPNFLLWKKPSANTPSNTSFAIRQLHLEEVKLSYSNAADNQLVTASFTDADFQGDFSQRRFRLKADATLDAGSLSLDGQPYLRQQALDLSFAMEVDLDRRELRFAESRIRLNREKLQLTGYHRWAHPQTTALDFVAESFDAAELLRWFADKNAFLNGLTVDGNLDLHGSININPEQTRFNLQARLRKGELGYVPYRLNFSGQLDARADFDRQQGLVLHFSGVQLSRSNEKLSGSLRYQQRSQQLSGSVGGQFSLQEWQPLLDSLDLDPVSGKLNSQGVQFSYRLGSSHWPVLKGTVAVSDLHYPSFALASASGALHFEGENGRILRLSNGQGNYRNAAVQAEGAVYNYPAVTSEKEGRYSVQGKLQLVQLLLGTDTASSTQNEAGPLSRLERFDLDLSLDAAGYARYRFGPTQLQLSGNTNRMQVQLNKLSLAGGKLSGKLNWGSRTNGYQLSGTISGKKLGMKSLFTSLHNFDQDFITDQNLDGQLDVDAELLLYFDQNYQLILPQLQLTADLVLRQGSLTNFAPMQGLARYVDANELRNLRFSELKNRIEIRNSTIFIPSMAINTNAAAFDISGEHDFNNAYTYYVKLSLTDFWAKKQKRVQFDPSLIETKSDGGVNLYLVIRGKGSDFTVSYERLAVKNQLKEAASSAATDIRRLVREELNGQGDKPYENDKLDAFQPIEVQADTVVTPKEPEFDPVYLRKPKSRKDAFKRDKR